MKKALVIPGCAFLLFYLVVCDVGLFPLMAQNRPRIAAIDDASRVPLANSTHPAVASAGDLGRVQPTTRLERMLLVLGPSDEMQLALHGFIDSLHDKASPNYHHWLTPQQFGERFGPAQADVDQIAAWLQRQGFDHVKVSPGRSHIEFSGSSQMVEAAFRTEMHSYQRGGVTHLANSADLSIPRAMSGIVRGVNLQSFSFAKPEVARSAAIRLDPATGLWHPLKPASAFPIGDFMDPRDFAKIYDLDRLYESGIDGRGETIAIVARSTIQPTDVDDFRASIHLAANDPIQIVNGPPASDPFGGDALEASLDAEWAGAIAPAATVKIVASSSTGTTDGVVLSSAYIVDNNLADVMSVSFEECEQFMGSLNNFFNALWQQAAAQGISVFVSSGDEGAAGCDAQTTGQAQNGLGVNGLASTPFNTAVGGTQFDDEANFLNFWTLTGLRLSPNGYIPEKVWNESCDPAQDPNCFFLNLDSGGGGVSTLYSKPSWQSTSILGVPNDSARDLPDVALSAAVHDGYLICFEPFGGCTSSTFGDQTILTAATGVGGTSASSPSFAAIMALVDQKQGGRQGLANYQLYRLAGNENFSNCNSSNRTDPTVPPLPGCIFNDVTAGNNGVPGNDVSNNPVAGALGYPATLGYDMGSGLGSVDAFNLVNSWNALSTIGTEITLGSLSATSLQHGQPLTFTINVFPVSGSTRPTGSVALIARTGSPFSTGIGVGGGTLVDGILPTATFTGTVNSLPGGSYSLVAHYAGDANFAPSDSNNISINVTPEDSSIKIIGFDQSGTPHASPLNFNYADPFTIGFQVVWASGSGIPTGTVTLFDGGQPIGQVPVDSDGFSRMVNCAFNGTFCLEVGSHTLTASYSGDAGLNPSTSLPFTSNLSKGAPRIFQTFGFNDTFVSYSLVVSPIVPIYPSGTATLSDTFNGQTSVLRIFQVAPQLFTDSFALAPGTHSFTLQYSGDSNYLAETTPPEVITYPARTGVPTQVTVTPLTASPAIGQPISVQVTVTSAQSSPTPTGNIFLAAPFNPRVFPLTNGSTIITVPLPDTGPAIVADYSGDSVYAPSAGTAEISVPLFAPTVLVTANLLTATPGEQVTLSGSIVPPPGAAAPTDTVQLFDSFNGGPPMPFGPPQLLASNPVIAHVAMFSFASTLPLGAHVFSASYSGDQNYNPVPAASSIPVTVNVVASLPPNPVSPNFGSVDVGSTGSVQGVTVTFSATGTLNTTKVVTQGVVHADFEFVDPGSCVPGAPFSAGQSCIVDIAFAPDFAGLRTGAVILTDAAGNVLGTQLVSGIGTGPQIAFDKIAPQVIVSSRAGAPNDAEFLAADNSGNLYVADNGNQRVIKVPLDCNSASCQTVVAGSANGLGAADGVAVDGAGNLYVSDPGFNQVLMIPPGCAAAACTQVIASHAAGEISTPRKLAVDAASDVFIADLNNSRVVEVPAGCATSTCQIPLGTGLNTVFGVAVDANGNVFISDFQNGSVVKLPPGCTGGACQSTVISELVEPRGIAVDAAGNLYIAENAKVVEVSSVDGSQRLIATGNQLGPFGNPTDVALGPSGNLFIADPNDNQIVKMGRGDAPFLGFDTTAVGTPSQPQPITVENIGTSPLSLFSVTPVVNTALDQATTTCNNNSTLNPGGSCALGVVFLPAAPGAPVIGFVDVRDNTRNQSNAVQEILVIGDGGNSQTIDFQSLPATVTFGVAAITLQATATSGLPVTFSVSGPASVSGSTLIILGAGSVTVTASQSGNNDFAPATPVSQTITVNPAAQTINFPPLPASVTFGVAPISLQATATSGLPVTYTVAGPASLSGSTLTILGAGRVLVTANQAGDANFAAAQPVSRSIGVNPADQTINFPPPPASVTFGVAPISLQATATSGLPVTYTVVGPASLSASTLTILGVGTVTVTANQAGNVNFNAATPVSQSITVTPAANTDFTVTSNTQSLSLQAGQSGTVTITVTPSGGFDTQVNFSCGQQTLVTCTFNPATLVPNGAPVSTTLTVTASSTSSSQPVRVASALPPSALALVSLIGLAMSILWIGISRQKSLRTRLAGALLPFCGVVIIVAIAGCGGGGSVGNPTPTPTPNTQTATVTVTASAGGSSHNLALTITVTR